MAQDHTIAEKVAALQQVYSLLGGRRVLSHEPTTRLEIHELLLEGLPSQAVGCLVESFELLRQPDAIEAALGISYRTIQRHRLDAAKHLSLEQSGRVWEFAELLARATSVLGSRQEAQQWLLRPAIALEQRRPLDLMSTSEGRRMVEELLDRLEFGVYT